VSIVKVLPLEKFVTFGIAAFNSSESVSIEIPWRT
jgi:hypothetical protein